MFLCDILNCNQGPQRSTWNGMIPLTLSDVELIHKLGWNNVVPNALSRKEEFQVEKLLTKTHALKAIFQGKSSLLEQKIREVYMQDPFTRCHFKELCKWKKAKGITLK